MCSRGKLCGKSYWCSFHRLRNRLPQSYVIPSEARNLSLVSARVNQERYFAQLHSPRTFAASGMTRLFLSGLQAALLDCGVGGRGRKPLNKFLRRLWMCCRHRNAGRKNRDSLRPGGQWAYDVDAFHGAQFADLLEADLEFSRGDDSAHRVRFDLLALHFDLVGDPEFRK